VLGSYSNVAMMAVSLPSHLMAGTLQAMFVL
jgi:hypothetical protein